MYKIYHNPKCKKSRCGLDYLKNKTDKIEIIDYLKQGLSLKEMTEIIARLNIKPIELVRTQEELYKKELKNRQFTDEEWVRIIIENPKLLRRPIIINKMKAVIGDPAEDIDRLF